jgi:hypothetical protein
VTPNAPLSTALSCRCSVALSETVRDLFARVTAPLPYDPAGEHRLDLLVNADVARLTYTAAAEAPIWTLIRRAGTRAAELWDHETRHVLHVPHERMPTLVLAAPAGMEVDACEREDGGTARIILHDDRFGAFRLELSFAREPSLETHALSLLHALFGGPSCHAMTGFPFEELEKLGCLQEALASRAVDDVPLMRLAVEDPRAVEIGADDFEPPPDFKPYPPPSAPTPEATPSPTPDSPAPEPELRPSDAHRSPEATAALQTRMLTAPEAFTPDCFGDSTRFGSMAALFHQDALDHLTRLVNTVAPFLGTVTSGSAPGGPTTIVIPWLTTLSGAGPTAPGSGVFSLLRVPRTLTSGGVGLMDLLAVQALSDDSTGPSWFERAVASGEAASAMRSWGLLTAPISNLFAARGVFTKLTTSDRVGIMEAYETMGPGVLRVGEIPPESDISVPDLVSAKINRIVPTVNFAALGTTPLVFASSIGTDGNIIVGLSVPPTTFSLGVVWALDPLIENISVAVDVLTCIFMPFLCLAAVALSAVLSGFLSQQMTTLTAVTRSVNMMLEIQYQWDAQAGLLRPSVRVLGTAGSITITPTWATPPNPVRAWIELIVTTFGNEVNLWVGLLADAVASQAEDALRANGLDFPTGAGDLGLNAVSGSATSAQDSVLLLRAELAPRPGAASGPFSTQVPNAETIERQLFQCHSVMRAGLTPPPVPPPLGMYAGLGVSQNAIDYYVDAHWRRGSYNAEITDSAAIARLIGFVPKVDLPPSMQTAAVVRIHAWPAASPRIEISESALGTQQRPLVATFDDVRICFETGGPPNNDRHEAPLAELSVNVRTTAVVTLALPFTPKLLFDRTPTTIEVVDSRVWDIADTNAPLLAPALGPAWTQFAREIFSLMLEGSDSAAISPAPSPPAWTPPIPAGEPVELIHIDQPPPPITTQAFYSETLGRRRALYLLPIVRTTLLEFVDGSGAPTLNTFLGKTGVTLSNMVAADGVKIRALVTAALQRFTIPP